MACPFRNCVVMRTGDLGESLAMEYATGLLLAESALENYTRLPSEFSRQVDAMVQRIEFALRDLPPGANAATWAGDSLFAAAIACALDLPPADVKSGLRSYYENADSLGPVNNHANQM